MRQEFHGYPDRAERLKKAMRKACRLSAVITKTEYGLLIELSNGRVCTVSDELWLPKDGAMTAAVQWARRHGASSVKIYD